jgi:hypothetical protein
MSNSVLTRQQITTIAKRWINEINVKRIETGYANNQPKWPYWVRPYNYARPAWHEMSLWMLDTFGDSDWLQENALWVGSDYKYWFHREQDRTLFLLRWS